MAFFGTGLQPAKQNRGECHEAYREDIMVAGTCPRKSVPHLNKYLLAPLTDQEKQMGSILEIVQVERHAPILVTRYRYSGRNLYRGWIPGQRRPLHFYGNRIQVPVVPTRHAGHLLRLFIPSVYKEWIMGGTGATRPAGW